MPGGGHLINFRDGVTSIYGGRYGRGTGDGNYMHYGSLLLWGLLGYYPVVREGVLGVAS